MKKFGNIKIEDPANVTNPFDTTDVKNLTIWNNFLFPLYKECYRMLGNSQSNVIPQIDYDVLKHGTTTFKGLTHIVSTFSNSDRTQLNKYNKGVVTSSDWNKDPERSAFTIFLNIFPEFSHLIQNINIKTELAIKAAELDKGEKVNATNFMDFKRYLDRINRNRWTREMNTSEKQGGVSILGSTSEKLLELSMDSLIDGVNFFKVNNDRVNSYGDFILMCLPNNLWLSVKSNYARERLLASGYTTDIVGVGYFTEAKEFTSTSKIRNFQRVGFLAMYIPDAPISEAQIENNTSTYDEVIEDYKLKGKELPKNINGTPFIRKLSSIGEDMASLLQESNISKRLVLDL
ncbi:hypothetical protein [Galenea microaerophila]